MKLYDIDISKKPSAAYNEWFKYSEGDMFFAIMLTSIIGIFVGVMLVLTIHQCLMSVPVCEKTESYTVCKDVYQWESRPYIEENE